MDVLAAIEIEYQAGHQCRIRTVYPVNQSALLRVCFQQVFDFLGLRRTAVEQDTQGIVEAAIVGIVA